jgi:hypothetical protein
MCRAGAAKPVHVLTATATGRHPAKPAALAVADARHLQESTRA